jgi:hypothetical protein
MFANVIDSSQVRVQRGGSSTHEYYATQIQQQQTLIQVSSKDNNFHFNICIDLKR